MSPDTGSPGGTGGITDMPDEVDTGVFLRLDPINILIVDDEPRNLTVLETILDDPGYHLVRAESADQALLSLVANEFALLILDVRMPGMTGFELATMIRKRRKTEQVPIIFLTAYYNEDQHVLEGYGTGAVDYLHKPVNPVILRSKVAVYADLHRKNAALESTNRALVTEVTERRQAQKNLHELNETLEKRVQQRTAELVEQTRLEKAQREQLRASEEFNRSLMEGTADSVQILDREGRVLHVNGPGRIHLEIESLAWVQGKHWSTLWPRETRQEIQQAVEKARNGEIVSFTLHTRKFSGTRHWWNVSLSAVRDPVTGQVARLIAVSRDVTEARESEDALRASDQQKDNFIATLAHELRNPLAPIRNALMIMRSKETQDTQLSWCRDVIDRQVRQMARLLDDLLDVSRISRSRLQLQCERFELAILLEQGVEIARPAIEEANHTLTIEQPPQPVQIYGDLTRLAQVLSNLLINAAKYTPQSGRIWLGAQEREGNLILSVKDSGIGITPEQMPRVFEMFSQASLPNWRAQAGLGIGLALARGLVEMHGGQLTGFSAGAGQGSEFIVRLPLNRGVAPAKPAIEPVPPVLPVAPAKPGAPPTCRVLVVDDLRDSADSLGMVVQSMGHEVKVTYDGRQALQVAEQFRPHVALIDLGMPEIDGYEVCRRIRSQPWGTGMILVAHTGWGQEFDRRRTQAAGFDQHLVKPLQWDVVETILDRAAAKARGETNARR